MCIRDSPNVIDLAFEFTENENRETNNKIIIFFIIYLLLVLVILIIIYPKCFVPASIFFVKNSWVKNKEKGEL